MKEKYEGLSRNAEKAVKAIRSVAEQGFAGDVNAQLTKMGLGRIKLPEVTKLDLLATAYEKKVELRYRRPLPDNSHFIPTAELENIGDRAIAAELRRRISELEQNSTGKV
jgi:hypothetical protein